ncbi:hypothetical protein T09_9935 [Trichinella sp. T9]|nr:hypothetical protein T09_9935 [Trichinella sp. T9]
MTRFMGHWLVKHIVTSGKNEYLPVLSTEFRHYSSGNPISQCETDAQDTTPDQNESTLFALQDWKQHSVSSLENN